MNGKGPRRGALALRVVGISSVVLSVLGLLYHASYLRVDYSCRDNPPFFFQAWYTMAAVNVALLVAALLPGIDFIALRTRRVTWFVVVEALILLDTFLPGGLWLQPKVGSSVAAASGISGGTIFHVITLFPFWGSFLAIRGSRRLRTATPVEVGV